MKITKITEVESIPLSEQSISDLYSSEEDKSPNKDLLKNIVKVFDGEVKENFQCFIEKKAYDAFIQFANEKYRNYRHEATGVIVGYYLHNVKDPSKKIIVGTNFLAAKGKTTPVTCEISKEDVMSFNNFCIKNKMLIIVWIHSHPTYGTFYSPTDYSMIESSFNAKHQEGIVVDNVNKEVMGFKVHNNKTEHEDVYIFDLDESIKKGKLDYKHLYKKVEKSNEREENTSSPTEIEVPAEINDNTTSSSEGKECEEKKDSKKNQFKISNKKKLQLIGIMLFVNSCLDIIILIFIIFKIQWK